MHTLCCVHCSCGLYFAAVRYVSAYDCAAWIIQCKHFKSAGREKPRDRTDPQSGRLAIGSGAETLEDVGVAHSVWVAVLVTPAPGVYRSATN